jgi:hypothetical protein
MTRWTSSATTLVVSAACAIMWTASASGAVLCQKRSGAVVVRDACKKKERPLDLAGFGAVGPKGDAGDPGPVGSIEGAPAGGDLSGTYPAPSIAPAATPSQVAANPETATDSCGDPTPQSGVLCGTASQHWREGFASPVKFWRDRLGVIHIRGSAQISSGAVTHRPLFFLPVGSRPVEPLAFPVVVLACGACEAGTALVFVNPNGQVSVSNASVPDQNYVILGDIQFRPDA